ncbi:MAG: cytochrome c3 family protein [Myxococcota bacterium]
MKQPFAPWTNKIKILLGLGAAGAVAYIATILNFGFSPEAVAVGYKPKQPVPFSHALHSGELGMDCRYCHQTVEYAKHSAVPSTETCMACHTRIHTESPKLEPVRQSWESEKPVAWVRIHDLADYAYFDHSAHVQKGVGCTSCHGRVDKMEEVYQHERLSMGWCLDCHRNPQPHLRPKHLVTKMDWEPADNAAMAKSGSKLMSAAAAASDSYHSNTVEDVNPPQSCGACHR